MIKTIKNCFEYFSRNRKAFTIFSFLYSLLSTTLFILIVRLTTRLSMMVCNIDFIGDNTLVPYFTSPFTWLMLLLDGLILTFISLIYICALIYATNLSRKNIKASFNDLLVVGVNSAKRVFIRKNFLIVIYILILIPFVGTIEITGASLSVGIPGFILDAIFANKWFTIALIAFLLLLVFITLDLAASLPIYTIEGRDFKQAAKESKQLMKGKRLSCFTVVNLYCLLFYAVLIALSIVVYLLFDWIYIVTNVFLFNSLKVLLSLAVLIYMLVNDKAIYIVLTTTFYFSLKEEKNIEIIEAKHDIKENKTIEYSFFVVCVISCLLMFIPNNNDDMGHSLNIMPSIAAHRGDSVNAPENSLPAFKLAIEGKVATWVELDVHQTKDGVIIVSHDDNLSRIGIDRCVHDSTYEELMQYDSGIWFSDEYKGLHLCTLKEALELMKDKVSVQIEIKPTEYDNHIEEAVLDIIKEVNSSLPNIVLSMSDVPLKRIKEIDSTFPTIYCTIVATAGIEDMGCADFFSVEESCISEELVNNIHKKGKKCFVWTINKPDNVQYLVDCGVDVILSDDPQMIQDALEECNYIEAINNYFFEMYEALKNN